MSASIVCLFAALSAAPDTDGLPPIYVPGRHFASVIRAQAEEGTQGYDVLPPADADASKSDPFLPPQGGYLGPAQPYGNNPYRGRPGCGPGPRQGGRWGMFAFGPYGPQPYRWGWTHRYDVGFLPKEPTERGLGQFGIFEFEAEWEYTTRISPGAIFSFTQQFDLRSWDGPTASPIVLPTVSLPGNVFHIGWDFELATPGNGPWSAQIAFNPSINSDFDSSLSSNAWNFDSRGILFYRPSPQLMYAFGAGFWDRVNDKVVPYAGAVWTPNNRWEWRLIFPEPRATYYMGHFWGSAHWAYVRGEYHIEAYETQMELTGAREKVELEDWRILFGIRKKNRRITSFYEAGWVFGRNVAFANGTPGFDVSSGFILRGGVRF